ncbi:MAG: hypothetical protein IPN17_21165 [Deltaproteobacteria bacterium]|nr:hypothetical protein [Deltaproteobacteria bacterium]
MTSLTEGVGLLSTKAPEAWPLAKRVQSAMVKMPTWKSAGDEAVRRTLAGAGSVKRTPE